MSQETAFAIFISLAVGFALGAVYVLLCTRRSGDKSDMQLQSLKQAAKEMIENGNLAGLNPHKVYKFCKQYEQMAADNKQLREDVNDMCNRIADILRIGECEHDDGETTYFVNECTLLDIIEKKQKQLKDTW